MRGHEEDNEEDNDSVEGRISVLAYHGSRHTASSVRNCVVIVSGQWKQGDDHSH